MKFHQFLPLGKVFFATLEKATIAHPPLAKSFRCHLLELPAQLPLCISDALQTLIVVQCLEVRGSLFFADNESIFLNVQRDLLLSWFLHCCVQYYFGR